MLHLHFCGLSLSSLGLTIHSLFKMRSCFLLAALPLVHGVRIIQSNDDGWAEANLRTFFDVLDKAGQQVVLSAPAEQQSGTGIYQV